MNPSAAKTYRESFPDVVFPTRREEAWRYVDLTPILETAFVEPEKTPSSFSGSGRIQIVFMNGKYSPEFSELGALPKGTAVRPLRGGISEKNSDPFAAINARRFRDGVWLDIPDESCLIDPVHVFFVSAPPAGAPCVFYPRLLVHAGNQVRASFILHYTGETAAAHFVNAVNEFQLGKKSHVDVVQLSRDRGAFQFAANRFLLDEGSSLESSVFTSDASRVLRNDSEIHFRAPKAFASMKGLTVLKGDSESHHHVQAIHAAPGCTSRQFYKTILTDRARSEFDSLVRVHPNAEKSDSKQLSRSLLLSETAQGFARPKLIIENDDVSCHHGATVGPIEKDELFYLRSRGLSKSVARFLLTYGFAQEIIDEIRDKSLKNDLEKNIQEAIKGMVKT
ncbi:MAG: SufD family Fe-S cluster assembly protein [Candidatus Omnitrophica bacterium]|nr:SufD family Fe-S cluster assembly protein [Candidatus Omnitrophota bacterium]